MEETTEGRNKLDEWLPFRIGERESLEIDNHSRKQGNEMDVSKLITNMAIFRLELMQATEKGRKRLDEWFD